jgi:hypothetical protein
MVKGAFFGRENFKFSRLPYPHSNFNLEGSARVLMVYFILFLKGEDTQHKTCILDFRYGGLDESYDVESGWTFKTNSPKSNKEPIQNEKPFQISHVG